MKLFRDTLTSPGSGRFSRKSVTAFASFTIAVIMAMSHHFFGYELNETVFAEFLLIGSGSLLLSSGEKAMHLFKNQKNAQNK